MLTLVIALIAIPSVNKVVEQAKIGANTSTANTYIKQAQSECQIKQINGEEYESSYHLSDFSDKVNGNKNVQGYVTVNSKCEVELVMQVDNTKDYCYVKSLEDDTARYYKNENGVCTPENVTPVEDSCFEYTEEGNEITITGYKCGGKLTGMTQQTVKGQEVWVITHTTGEKMDVVIPSTINGKSVTKIGAGSFSPIIIINEENNEYNVDYESNIIITSLAIPSSVKEIEYTAFMLNALKSVTFSEGLEKIGNSAFASNRDLKSVVLPNSLTSIGVYAFLGSGLTSVTFGNGLSKIEYDSFKNNNIKNVVLSDSIKELSQGSFSYNKIEKMDFKNVEIIDGNVFKYNNLSGKLVLGNKVKSVGTYTFQGNHITSVEFNNLETIAEGAFSDNDISNRLVIGSHVKSIGRMACIRNKIEEVEIPSSVTDISEGAFQVYETTEVSSNFNLKKVINKTGRAFDWDSIIRYVTSTPFETGTINIWKNKNVYIVAE